MAVIRATTEPSSGKGYGRRRNKPLWNIRRLSKERLRVYLVKTRFIDEHGWMEPAGSLEDTVHRMKKKVVAACDDSIPRRKRSKPRLVRLNVLVG